MTQQEVNELQPGDLIGFESKGVIYSIYLIICNNRQIITHPFQAYARSHGYYDWDRDQLLKDCWKLYSKAIV